MTRLILAAALLLGVACAGPRSGPSPTLLVPSPSPSVSASPVPVNCANLPPVYHPERLQQPTPADACVTFKGLVIAKIHETTDGDYHLWIEPDAGYEGLLNAANDYHGHKALVAEIVPVCPTQPGDAATAAKCPASKVHEPAVGDHVMITGPHVLDTHHGWMEVHPIAYLAVLPALSVGDPSDDA